ncbi:MAG: hypothetical protein QW775_05275 [Ignisphaera sp.]
MVYTVANELREVLKNFIGSRRGISFITTHGTLTIFKGNVPKIMEK